MIKTKFAALCIPLLGLALACPQLVRAQSSPDTATGEIRSVWDLSLQPCNGRFANAMTRNAEEATIKATRKIILKDAGFQVTVPRLPELAQSHVKLFLNDKSRGVTDHYVLLGPSDLGPPIAAIVVTELPPALRNNSAGLRAAATMQSRSSLGAPFSFSKVNGPHGESIEMLVPNRLGSHCYPTADFQVSPDTSTLSTLGISRFSVLGDKLVEFSIVVKVAAGTGRDKAIEQARTLMDAYWTALSAL